MKLKMKKRQSGFTLVELGIVVAIAAVIIGIGLVVVPSILASTRANGEISDLPAITTKIQRSFANQPNYSSPTAATMPVLINLRVFPESEVNGTTVNNRWGGTITAAVDTLKTAGDAVTITETNLPQAECVQVIQGVDRSYRKIAVNGTGVKADGEAQIHLDTLGTACGTGGNNSIALTFGK